MPELLTSEILKTKGGALQQTAGKCPKCGSRSWYHWRDDYPGAPIVAKCMFCGHTEDIPVKKQKAPKPFNMRYTGLIDLPFEPLPARQEDYIIKDIVMDTRRYSPRFTRRVV